MNDDILSLFIAVLLIAVLGFAVFGVISVCQDIQQGADGQDCYDNLTCDKGAVCYRLGEDTYECRGVFPTAVKP